MEQKSTLPTRLTLAEEGQWETPSWAQTSDNDEWISYGWKAWTYDGIPFFRHQEKSVVQQWLADNGYTDTGDGAHYQRQEVTEGIFKSAGHKTRFVGAMLQIGKVDSGKFDPEYAAALYVLTADLSTWNKAQEYMSHNGIDFEALLKEVDWSGGYRVLIQWAANLFNEYAAHCDPVELMRLDESNFQVAITALHIRRYSLHVDDFKE